MKQLSWLLLAVLLLPAPVLAQDNADCALLPGGCDEGPVLPRINIQIDLSKLKANKKPPPKVRAKSAAKPVAKPRVALRKKPAVTVAKKAKPLPRKQALRPEVPKPSWAGLPEIPVVTLNEADMRPIAGQFIVDFNLDALRAAGLDLATITIPVLADRLGLRAGQIRSVQRRFLISAAVNADPQQATALAANPLISEVYEDTQIKAAGDDLPLSWGLDRLDSPVLPLDGRFDRDFGDYETRIYLFDSAVDAESSEFGNRVKQGASFVPPVDDPTRKCREHGTEMASLLVGQTLGAAPKAELVSLAVLPCERERTGAVSSLIEAVEWVLISEADFGDGKPAVANMSFGGIKNAKTNKAVKTLMQSGIAVVTAAGNESADACRFSPASATEAITVAATGPKDETPSFSNFGACVDINAPGRLLTALTEGNRYVAVNGTSGATALVTGLLARSLVKKGTDAASTWLAEAAVPAKLWRKDESNVLLAQASAGWRGLCRLSAQTPLRARAKPDARITATLTANTLVRIERQSGSWLRIAEPDGAAGWLPKATDGNPTLLDAGSDAGCKAVR